MKRLASIKLTTPRAILLRSLILILVVIFQSQISSFFISKAYAYGDECIASNALEEKLCKIEKSLNALTGVKTNILDTYSYSYDDNRLSPNKRTLYNDMQGVKNDLNIIKREMKIY